MGTKILIVEDHPIAQKGIKSLILTEPGFEVCGILDRINDVIPFVSIKAPDVILLDLNFPDGNSVDILAELIGSDDWTVIILTGDATAKSIQLCAKLGVRGIVSKGDKGESIVKAIKKAIAGDVHFYPEIEKIIKQTQEPEIDLSPRQMAILHFMADGITNKEISYRLRIAAPTVSFHVGEIRKKLNVATNKKILPRAAELNLF